MERLLSITLRAIVASALAVTAACTDVQRAGNNNNHANGNAGLQSGGNANAAQPTTDKPPAKAEQAGAGSIEVKSMPPGARVILISLDEEGAEPQQRGLTPTTLTGIPVGKYTVDVEKPGYKFFQKNIKVQENKTVQVIASLQKE